MTKSAELERKKADLLAEIATARGSIPALALAVVEGVEPDDRLAEVRAYIAEREAKIGNLDSAMVAAREREAEEARLEGERRKEAEAAERERRLHEQAKHLCRVQRALDEFCVLLADCPLAERPINGFINSIISWRLTKAGLSPEFLQFPSMDKTSMVELNPHAPEYWEKEQASNRRKKAAEG